mmetsp:Transcript_51568/g.85443  ORF Transcript_51568/g.85443 Transcript_51568/m.85443 type:complete len:83 (+) Transcript_51568:228-476(+)
MKRYLDLHGIVSLVNILHVPSNSTLSILSFSNLINITYYCSNQKTENYKLSNHHVSQQMISIDFVCTALYCILQYMFQLYLI